MLTAALAIVFASGPRARATSEVRVAPPEIGAIQAGFIGRFKLGCWTEATVELVGGDLRFDGKIDITAPDSDGVLATTSSEFSLAAGEKKTVSAPLRLGQEAGVISVRIRDNDNNDHAHVHRTFYPGRAADSGGYPTALPSTARLVVTYGATADLAADLASADNEASPTADVHSVLVGVAASLPTQWYGYESVDTVILSGADLKAYADADLLAPRIAALNRWVELGGRLVIFCGADSAELLAEGAPLAPLLPGRYSGEVVPLPDYTPLEAFAAAAGKIPRASGRDRLRVPRLVETQGRLLAQGPSATPLVLRARRGFGEVTFVAVDPEAEPIASWEDRTNFLRQSLRWPAPATNVSRDRGRSTSAAADMVNQLRSALDQHFTGVATASFGLVALLTLGYIALVGPADFFLLRAIKRPHLTWLTFPLVVVATCAGAYALAYRMKGTESVINQVEIVDVDATTGATRGTVWAHAINPRVNRFSLSLIPHFAGKQVETPESLVAPLGVPGYGLGGMQGQRAQPALFERGYGYLRESAPDCIVGYPIEQWSTRTLAARWSGAVGPTIDADLHPRGDDELTGELTNRTGVRLADCVLIRGTWAYALPPLADGATYSLAKANKPRTLRTTLTNLAAGDDPNARTAEDGSVPFDPLSTDVARIVKLMMFYDAMGGAAYASTPNRYQGFIDMSRLLAGNDAILLARGPATQLTPESPPSGMGASMSSAWRMTGAEPRSMSGIKQFVPLSDKDKNWTYYRFIIPLQEPIADAPTSDRPEADPEPLLGPQPFGS
jgi:hypothetical protein